MGMEGLPARLNQTAKLSPRDLKRLKRQAKVAELLGNGMTPKEVVALYAKGDAARAKAMRKTLSIWRMEAQFLELVEWAARGELAMNVGAMVNGLTRRAKTGRPDAVKLALEVTGTHNPKMQHEHSGDISIRLELPRPKPVDVPDAEEVS